MHSFPLLDIVISPPSSLDRSVDFADTPYIRQVLDSPSEHALVHQSPGVSTPLLDSSIVSPLTSIRVCMHGSFPRAILEEDLSSQCLKFSKSLNGAPFLSASSHLRTTYSLISRVL